MTQPVGVGIIGLGFMGRTHLMAYRKADERGLSNRLVAVCDRDPDLRSGHLSKDRVNLDAASAGRSLFDPEMVRAYEDPDELLQDPEVTLVSICTYTPTHVPLALKALEAGKHVLVEKPLALRAKEARRLLDASARAGTLCMPAMCMRFWPGWSWLKEQMASEVLGRVRSAAFRRLGGRPAWGAEFYQDDQACGSALFDLHVHDTDFILHSLGLPAAVTSVGDVAHLTTLYHFNRGPEQVVAEGGWLPSEAYPFEMGYRVVFEEAVADFDLAREPPLLLYRGSVVEPVALEPGDGYQQEVAHLLEAILSGRTTLQASVSEACTLVTVLEKEEESLRSARTVAL